MALWRKRISSILSGGNAPTPTEGEQFKIESPDVEPIPPGLPEPIAQADEDFQLSLGYLYKKLDFLQVQRLITGAIQGLGRLVGLRGDVNEDGQDGAIRVIDCRTDGYFVNSKVDGTPAYYWVDENGYFRQQVGSEPTSDSSGQIVGPTPSLRIGATVHFNSSSSITLNPGVIEIDGVTCVNDAAVILSTATATLPSLVWAEPSLSTGWQFLWAVHDGTGEGGYSAVATPLRQPTSVSATVLTDSTATFKPGVLIGSSIGIVYGTGSLNWYTIADNTATTITVAGWVTQPTTSSYYMIQPLVNGYLGRLIGQLFCQGGTPTHVAPEYAITHLYYTDVVAGQAILPNKYQTNMFNDYLPIYLARPSRVTVSLSMTNFGPGSPTVWAYDWFMMGHDFGGVGTTSTSYSEPNQTVRSLMDLPVGWTSDANCYFEVIIAAGGGGTAYAELYNVTDAASVSGSEVSTTSASATRLRSGTITLRSDKVYTIRTKCSTGGVAFYGGRMYAPRTALYWNRALTVTLDGTVLSMSYIFKDAVLGGSLTTSSWIIALPSEVSGGKLSAGLHLLQIKCDNAEPYLGATWSWAVRVEERE